MEVDAGQPGGRECFDPRSAAEVAGAKQDRCQRSIGVIRSGNATVRVPVSDFGGPNARPPFWSSVRERSTRTVPRGLRQIGRRSRARGPRKEREFVFAARLVVDGAGLRALWK